MFYLLLLALVCVIGITTILISRATDKRATDSVFIIVGFVLLALSLVAQLALGFALDELFAKLFYWARISTALAWLGLGVLFLVQPRMQSMRWLVIGIPVATIFMLALVGLTQVTDAQDWYSSAQPIYAQINDLLATNRPTRWGSLALNIFGAGALLYSAFLILTGFRKLLVSGLLALAAIGFLLPIYLPLQTANTLFFMIELLPPLLLFAGLELLRVVAAAPRRKSR